MEDIGKNVKKLFSIKAKDFVISSNSKTFIVWKFIETALSIVSSLIYAFYAAYRVDVDVPPGYGPLENSKA